MKEAFGSTRVVSRGVLHDALSLPGLVAEEGSTPLGIALYRIVQDQCEVVVLLSTRPRQGIGSKLMQAMQDVATEAGCKRLWLITTNDNLGAIAFYQAIGMNLVAVHRGAIRESRKLKPEIPLFGSSGLPIEDEIEFEMELETG